MNTKHSDECGFCETLHRYVGPALGWAALFAFFAVAGALSHDEPTQMAEAAHVPRQMAHTTDAVAQSTLRTSLRESAIRDAAVVEHEALDPVGVGLTTTP